MCIGGLVNDDLFPDAEFRTFVRFLAEVAELADALDSKSSPAYPGCGFNSHLQHSSSREHIPGAGFPMGCRRHNSHLQQELSKRFCSPPGQQQADRQIMIAEHSISSDVPWQVQPIPIPSPVLEIPSARDDGEEKLLRAAAQSHLPTIAVLSLCCQGTL